MKFHAKALFKPGILIPVAALLTLVLGSAGVFWFQPRSVLKQIASQNPEVFFFAETEQKVLALTLDDAPDSTLTPLILDVLAAHDVSATFFILGENIAGNEGLLRRMKSEGHELGNHLSRDEATILLSDEEFAAQLQRVEELIGPLTGRKWCRPGSGWFTPEMVEVAHKLGYKCCLASIYPHDNKIRNAGFIRKTVMDRMFPGAILVLHEGGPERDYIVALLDELIPELKAEGYRFLTLTELAELDGR